MQQEQDRLARETPNYWRPLSVYPPRNLRRVAYLRRVLLKIHRDGLVEMEATAASRPLEVRAVADYRHMLQTIAAVARAADAGDLNAFYDTDVRMDRAILQTRDALKRAGAAHICSVAI